MNFGEFLATSSYALTEGSVYERLRRHPLVKFDPNLAHAALIYDRASARILEEIHREYLDIGQCCGLPMLALTDTWRANQERIQRSAFRHKKVNQDNVSFMKGIRFSYGSHAHPILIGGQIGPHRDAYRPSDALSPEAAVALHTFQVEALAEAGVDFLFASTLPAFSEAGGIATAMAQTGLPYLLSFVIRRDGCLLDDSPLSEVIEEIDQTQPRAPAGYGVNCVHPDVFHEGVLALQTQNPAAGKRILSFQANTSCKLPEELDSLKEIESEEPERLAELMWALHVNSGTRFMGGCCGTDARHIESIAKRYQREIG